MAGEKKREIETREMPTITAGKREGEMQPTKKVEKQKAADNCTSNIVVSRVHKEKRMDGEQGCLLPVMMMPDQEREKAQQHSIRAIDAAASHAN